VPYVAGRAAGNWNNLVKLEIPIENPFGFTKVLEASCCGHRASLRRVPGANRDSLKCTIARVRTAAGRSSPTRILSANGSE